MQDDKAPTIKIIYDDQCPFCRNYCKLVRLKQDFGPISLIDARKNSPEMSEVTKRGLDIDHGMVLILHGEYLYGAEAINKLALMSSRSSLFNKLNYHCFKSKKISKLLYPFLKNCRNLALKIMGIPLINNLGK